METLGNSEKVPLPSDLTPLGTEVPRVKHLPLKKEVTSETLPGPPLVVLGVPL